MAGGWRDGLIRIAALCLVAALVVACSGARSATPAPAAIGPTDATAAPYVLTVDDRSSWGTLEIAIGDAVVAHVDCDQTVAVAPGDPGVPPLPWTVSLVTASGQTVDQRTEDGSSGSTWLLVWDAEVDEGYQAALGPAPECAMPSPSIVPLPTAGLTSDAAIVAGTRLLAGQGARTVAIETATIGRLATYTTRAGVDPQRFVWALTFSGAFADPSACVASPPATPCPSQASALVVLDFRTGAELAVTVPAPPR